MQRTPFGFLFGALLTAAASTSFAQSNTVKPVWPDEGAFKWAPRPTSKEITANDLRTRLYQFADDSMAGRRIGELGNYKGTAYIASEFKRVGLKPGGDNGTYFQNMPFGPMGFDSTTSKLIAGSTTLSKPHEWGPVAPNAQTGIGGTVDLAGVPAVFAGRWGDTTTNLDAAQFRGKVVVFLAATGAPGIGSGRSIPVPRCDSVPNKFGAAAAAAVEAEQRAADAASGRPPTGRGRGGPVVHDPRAQRLGAAAILLVPSDGATPSALNAFITRGAMQPAGGTPTGIGAATISTAAAAKIFGKPVSDLSVGTTGQPISAHWNYEWTMSKTPARNVIAIMPGSDPARAGEYILISAHNDHVGTNPTGVDHDSLRAVNMVTRPQGANDPACRPTAEQQHRIDGLIAHARSIRKPRRDSIMNGADDDGSGTVIMLEVAEQFATEKPARSIIFVSHEGEEAGLLGSKWFTDHPTIQLNHVVAALNMDMEAKGRTDQVKFGGPSSIQTLGSRRLSREYGDIIDSVNAVRFPEVMAVDKSWDVVANPMNRFCRSDQVNYVLHDIPVTYFSTGYAEDYHQATDEPQYADYDHMARIGRFIHGIAMAVAERKDKPAISGADPAYPSCRR
ncbi:MAG TPA: M28 family peptidase [Gemmatimonadaceae bacterium]